VAPFFSGHGVLIGSTPNLSIKLRLAIALRVRGWSNITQIKSNMAAGSHLEKMDMTSLLRRRSTDYYEIWQADAK